MKRVILPPIYHQEGYGVLLEHEVLGYFRETLFDPLLNLVRGSRENAAPHDREHSAVWDAILAGTIWYFAGKFFGAFSAAISRELRAMGAHRIEKGFSLAADEVPIALRGAIASASMKSEALHQQVLSTLNSIADNAPRALPALDLERKVAKPVVADLQKQLLASGRQVEVPIPPAPAGLPKQLAENITAPTERSIKGFTREAIGRIQERVKANLSEGARPDRLEDIIEVEFGVAKRKARIIAEQETSQIVSDFRKDRYQALGSKRYVWDTSHDEKVRPTHGESNNHRVLDGREFAWDSPPIVDVATCRRCHPGEDFGPCRCVARPILTFA